MGHYDLLRNPAGRLVLRTPDGGEHEGVIPVRPFPISAPGGGVSLVDSHGHELVWIPNLEELDAEVRALVDEELGAREFTPEIQRIDAVSGFVTPCTWEVLTDRGPTRLVLKGEEDIRRLGQGALLISDSHGIQYLVRDLPSLDRKSRKLLDRFL
ncbi:MAG: hypothetical protein RIS35_1449 [Pseudomonadota bacterium]|jgi:hypothetical protein